MMDIFFSRGAQDPEVRIRFPAEPGIVWPMLTELDEYCGSDDPIKIVGTSSPVPNLAQYISCADVEQAADIRKLNILAEMVDGMGPEKQRTFSGSLDAESINGLDDVLRIAGSLDSYELFPSIKTDEELGQVVNAQRMELAEQPPVGRVTFASGERLEFTDPEEYLQTIREELPFHATTGFRFETLTGDPEIRKAADDAIYFFFGEENPRQMEDYQEPPGQGMTMDGL